MKSNRQKTSAYPSKCPKCGVSFRGQKIPEADRYSFGGEKYFSRAISLYSWGRDKCYGFKCPDCGHEQTIGSLVRVRLKGPKDPA